MAFSQHPIHDKDRVVVDVYLNQEGAQTLAQDVRTGLGQANKSLPSKYFYDDIGSKLFDRICDTPEYYPTRTELALIEQVADCVISETRPDDVIELGSGTTRKIRVVLDAIARAGLKCRYVPFDVSESTLRRGADSLAADYPWLKVRGIVGDYEHHLAQLPQSRRRLFVFLGGTLGNFEPSEAVEFLGRLAEIMTPADRLLLGTDLVKNRDTLDAAYNDDQGVTAAFNKNVLRVINRQLGGNFNLSRFEHIAFFNEKKEHIEMHLEAKVEQTVRIEQLGMNVAFQAGERILTEISRKFTRAGLALTLERANLQLERWFVPEDKMFALSLCNSANAT